MRQFKVDRSEAAKFAKVWNKGGVVVLMQDVHIDFATAFANVVLRNFVEYCKTQSAQGAQQPTQNQTVNAEPDNRLVLAGG